ncbi:MAG: hypothetical protein KDK70_37640 [Myxococcales bacterium]|nr:hypothetical protein [Myxococcales bacterium]
MHTPGPFAFLIFFLWIPVAAVIFAQNEPRRAGFIVVIGGTMFLPELVAFDAPILPPINKHVLVCALAFVGMFFTSKSRWQRMRLLRGAQLFFFILVVGNIGTAQTNPESFVFGGKLAWEGGPRFPVVVISPLSKTEFIPMSIEDFFRFIMPFAVGQMLVQSREDLLVFLKAYVLGCVIYVPLMLYEGVMSPQLHRIVYGYHALSFSHNVRGDGFKPVVFMQSGLGLAMFQFVGLTGALVLWRLRERVKPWLGSGLATAAILFALSVSRNVAVLIYTVAALPLIRWAGPRSMTRVAFVLAVVFLTFPITRAKDWFPADDIIAYVEARMPERAESLAMRFDNETMLIEHTQRKPYWGWGSFGRNRRYDPDSGKDISVTDGEWAIHYSVRGAIGVVGWFWLITLPCLWATRLIRRVQEPEDRVLLGAVALTAAINAVDLLPNSSFTMVPLVYSGILAGFLSYLSDKYPKRA